MERTCPDCGSAFDDAECTTICPHELLMPREDLDRKIDAIKLLGKRVRFANMPDVPESYHEIMAMDWRGMLTLRGLSGEFAPHLFIPEPVKKF